MFKLLIITCCIFFYVVAHKETLEEAAYNTRKLVSSNSLGVGTLLSTFPGNTTDGFLADKPTGLLEYFAPTGPHTEYPGSVYMLLMPVSPNVRNILATPGNAAAISVKDEAGERKHGSLWANNRARAVLWGNITILEGKEEHNAQVMYAATHPDSILYFPPHGPHEAFWARFDPQRVYYLGGFGNVHYIGDIPLDMYKNPPKSHNYDGEFLIQQ